MHPQATNAIATDIMILTIFIITNSKFKHFQRQIFSLQ